MNTTEQASSKLNNLRTLRAAAATELAATEARLRELTEAMGNGMDFDREELLRLPLEADGARGRLGALDEGIKAASAALTASQWADKLTAAREHKAARPDTNGEVLKLASSIRKKLEAIEAKASAWNAAGFAIAASAKGSPLRELATEMTGGGDVVVDGAPLHSIRTWDMNKWVTEALDELDREERETRSAAAIAAAGPDPYTPQQRMDAALMGMEVATYVERQRQEAEMIQRLQDEAWADVLSGPRPNQRGGLDLEAAPTRRNF